MKSRKNVNIKCKFNKNSYNNLNNKYGCNYNYQRCYNYNNYLSKQEFRERGVTIMSLVITIIVLLILAGITIKLALNDNGIIKQSKLASEEYQNKALQEQFALNQISKEIENASNNVGSGNQSSSGGSTSGGTSSGSSENTDELKKQIDELQAQVAALEAKQATGNATASQVLAGATFSTSEGVGLTGTMVNHSAITNAISVGTDENKVYLRTSSGAYLTNSTSGYPEICANISDINNATGYKYTKEQYDANYSTGYNDYKSKLTIHHHVTADGTQSDDEVNATKGGCYTKEHYGKEAYIAYYQHSSTHVRCQYDGVAGHNKWWCDYCDAEKVDGQSGGTCTWGSCPKRPYTAYKDVLDGYSANCGAVLAILP